MICKKLAIRMNVNSLQNVNRIDPVMNANAKMKAILENFVKIVNHVHSLK